MGSILIGLFLIVLIFVEPLPNKAYWKNHNYSIKFLIKHLIKNFNKEATLLLISSILLIFWGILKLIGKM